MGDAFTGRYSLRTLGSLGVHLRDEAGACTLVLGPGKPTALLAYLALAPTRSVHRDECIDLLWSNLEIARGQVSLRQALFHLRETLGADRIPSEGRRIVLHLDLDVDCLNFRAAAEADRPEAIELFTGRFLDSTSFPGGHDFEQWADRERARYETLLAHATDRIVQAALSDGRTDDAVRFALRTRDLLPRRQAPWRLLLETHLAAGNLALALIEADALARWLHDEDETPEPPLAAVLKRLHRSRDGARPSDVPFAVEYVGRETEFAQLLKAYHSMLGGRSRHLHVSAPAGMGKTRLLAEVGERLRLMHARVVTVAAVPSDPWLPYSLLARLAEVLGALPGAAGLSPASAGVLTRLVPALSSRFASATPVAAADDELTRSQVLRELVDAVAADRALVAIVDDLHWADHESLATLQRLADRLPGNILLLTAARPPVEIRATGTTGTCVLPPLTVEQVHLLLLGLGLESGRGVEDATTGASEQSTAVLLTRASGGSPLLIVQLLRQGLEEGWLRHDGERLVATSADSLATALEHSDPIGRRLLDLPPHDRAVLQTLALAGLPLETDTISEAVPGDVRLALQRLASRGLVTTADGGWICSHDLIGERALQDLSAPAKAAPHSALGRALGSGATRLRAVQLAARHLELGQDDEGLIDLAARFVDRRRAEGSRAHAFKIAGEAIGIEATRRIAPRLLRQRPWHERLRRPLAAAAIVLLTGATITAAVASAGRETSVLVLAQRPLALKAQTGRAITLAPPLVIEARRSRDSTRLTISDTISFLLLDRRTNRVDTTVRTMNGGRVEFVDVVGSTDVDAGVNFPQDVIVLSRRTGARTSVRLAGSKGSENTLRLVSFALGGATLTATRRTLRAPPNTFVHGWLRVEYSTYGVDETIVYAATPTWGRPEREGFAIGVLSTPTVGRQRTDSLGFRTPKLPGDYYMILVAGTETDAPFLLSQTNWVLRTPVWHDGNDIAAWSPAQIDQSIRSGYVEASILRLFQGKRMRLRSQVSATAFRVIVDPRVRGLTVE